MEAEQLYDKYGSIELWECIKASSFLVPCLSFVPNIEDEDLSKKRYLPCTVPVFGEYHLSRGGY